VKTKAEDVLKQAKRRRFRGAREEIFRRRGDGKNGGDLDYFGRGRMVPEFDQSRSRCSRAR